MQAVFLLSACVSIIAVALICIYLFANGFPAIKEIGVFKFLFGTEWNPDREVFGIFPMILGSIYVTAGAVLLGVPVAFAMAATAFVSAVYLSLYIHVMLYGNNTGVTIALCVASLVTLAAEIAYYAKVISLVNGRPMKWNIARCTNIAACYIAFCVVLVSVYAFVAYGVVMAKQPVSLVEMQPLFYIFGGVSIIVMFLLLPFIYVAMKYFMEPESRLGKIIFKSYKTGLRH